MDKNKIIRKKVCTVYLIPHCSVPLFFTVPHVHTYDMFHLIQYCCLKLKLLLSVRNIGQTNMSILIKKIFKIYDFIMYLNIICT